MKTIFKYLFTLTVLSSWLVSCGDMNSGKSSGNGALSGNAAEKVYVAPGEHDEFYAFVSGGFSGQLAVYGLPSGRLFKVIPVFSVDAEKAWGFNEETKPMLNTSHGFIPWMIHTTRIFLKRRVNLTDDGCLLTGTIHRELPKLI